MSAPRNISAAIALVAVAGAAFLAGRDDHASPGIPLYYVDPMHPQYRSDRPGTAPDCGMPLEPVYAGGAPAAATAPNPTELELTRDQEQAIRLATETLQSSAGTRRIWTAGRVAADEAGTFRVSAGVDGWLRRVFSDRTGAQVAKGQALATFYSKDVSSPQQAYLYALDSCERLKPAGTADQLALAARQLAIARDNLQFVGIGEAQIEALARTRAELFDIDLTAPAAGQILERNVAVGQRFMKGETLYRIADLSHVWVLADTYGGETSLPGAGGRAWIEIAGLPPLEARVAAVPPQFDAEGRTGKLRLEVANPDRRLLPGMVVRVAFDPPSDASLTVHAGAVVDSGTGKRVFVALGGGRYELRDVQTGWQDGDRVQILGGLRAGESVVTAGAFLLDSESRLRSLEPRQEPPGESAVVTDTSCGMKIARAGARRVAWQGTDYFFCSAACQRKFENQPRASAGRVGRRRDD